jgi:hypothetical protein
MLLLRLPGNGLSGFKGTVAHAFALPIDYAFAVAPEKGKGLCGFEGTVKYAFALVPRKRLV